MFTAIDTLKIGERNTVVVKEELKKAGIRLIAEDTGKTCARTVTLDTRTGKFSVKTKEGVKTM